MGHGDWSWEEGQSKARGSCSQLCGGGRPRPPTCLPAPAPAPKMTPPCSVHRHTTPRGGVEMLGTKAGWALTIGMAALGAGALLMAKPASKAYGTPQKEREGKALVRAMGLRDLG